MVPEFLSTPTPELLGVVGPGRPGTSVVVVKGDLRSEWVGQWLEPLRNSENDYFKGNGPYGGAWGTL